jgi:SAM-dependent methyltransferase
MNEQQHIGIANLDWRRVWNDMYTAERAQAEQVPLPDPARVNDCWSGQARRFAAANDRAKQPDLLVQFLLPRLLPSDTVLDIGAGAGRHSVALAPHVARVIAVEPSAAMREQLAQRCAGIDNIEIVAHAWPTAVAACDVAISAHVLYAVAEPEAFLRQMDAVAQRLCVLWLGVRHPAAFISPFWEAIYGEPRLPLPGALECLNLLDQLGITASLQSTPTTPIQFASRDELLADLGWRLRLVPDSAQRTILETVIDHLFTTSNDGHLQLSQPSRPNAILWWEKTTDSSVYSYKQSALCLPGQA